MGHEKITESEMFCILKKTASLAGPALMAGFRGLSDAADSSSSSFSDLMKSIGDKERKDNIFKNMVEDEPVILDDGDIIVGNMRINPVVLQERPDLLPPEVVNIIKSKLSNKILQNILTAGEPKKDEEQS